ncbi:hypothetical protein TcBrA4_0069270 [Trypanosoma cruzi]|nr:hypothetical protein TcBrA4_0096320 [Trypanosoma cruzi]KAF8296939.1 hypothetical protein TcBrA4_0069270 [Trypanosoma cruzi]
MRQPSDTEEPLEPKESFNSDCILEPGSAPSVSAVDKGAEALDQLRRAHAAMQRYMTAETEAYAEDWKLLGKCNELMEGRCQEVRASAKDAVKELETTAELMEHSLPQLASIDKIEVQLATLTESVNRIDEYSKALADRFECT